MSDFDLHASMVHFHVLYQLKTGQQDGGQAFITWFWANKASFPDAISQAIELITDKHVTEDDSVMTDEAQDIVWELANRLKIADTAIRGMEQPIVIGGAS